MTLCRLLIWILFALQIKCDTTNCGSHDCSCNHPNVGPIGETCTLQYVEILNSILELYNESTNHWTIVVQEPINVKTQI